MTRLPRWAAAALGAALAGAACVGPTGVPPDPTTATAPASSFIAPGPDLGEGGEAVVGLGDVGAPRGLNPLLAGPDTAVLDMIRPAVGASAFRVDPETGEVFPDLLLQIPTPANGGIVDNGDGTVSVTLRIDPEARWSDGTPLTGEDFVFTQSLLEDPTLAVRPDVLLRHAGIAPGTMTAAGGEVSFRMERSPDVELLFPIVVPRHQVADTDFADDWNDAMWASAGPFVFESWQAGEYLELHRNPQYDETDEQGVPLPYLARVVIRFFDVDRGVDPRLEPAFRGRQLDVATIPEPRMQAHRFEALADRGALVARGPATAWYQLNFQFGAANRNVDSLNRHIEFRRAVAYSLDRDGLAAGLGTAGLDGVLEVFRADLSVSPWQDYLPDPERAVGELRRLGRRLGVDLFEAGGARVVLVAPAADDTTVELAGEIAAMLADVGLGAELQLEEPATFFGGTLNDGSWDVGLWRLPAGPGAASAVDLVEAFDPDGSPPSGSNVFRWGTPGSSVADASTAAYADLVDRIRDTIEPVDLDRLLQEAEAILAEELVIIPIAGEEAAVAWWDDELTGPAVHPWAGILWNVATWRRQPD